MSQTQDLDALFGDARIVADCLSDENCIHSAKTVNRLLDAVTALRAENEQLRNEPHPALEATGEPVAWKLNDPDYASSSVTANPEIAERCVRRGFDAQPLYLHPAPPVPAWKPIETAPRDGSEVLLFFPHRDLVIRGSFDWQGEGDWEMGIADWRDWNTDDDVVIQEDPSYIPTHWMPLPPAPEPDQ